MAARSTARCIRRSAISGYRARRAIPFLALVPFTATVSKGLFSGPALARRFGVPGHEIDPGYPRWDDVANDIAHLVSTVLLGTAARQVLIGGGVGMGRSDLLDRVREKVVAQLGGYLPNVDRNSIDGMVTAPLLGDQAGPPGRRGAGHGRA